MGRAPATSPTLLWRRRRNLLAFWLLGLLNNAPYVVMIAGAKEIEPAAVGLVYFCAIAPVFVVKLSGPYWRAPHPAAPRYPRGRGRKPQSLAHPGYPKYHAAGCALLR